MVLMMDGNDDNSASKHCRNGDRNESTALLREISTHLKRRSFQDVRNSATLGPLSVEPTSDSLLANKQGTTESKIHATSENICDGILSEVSCKQLRRLLLLHLDLIEEQQKQIVERDRMIAKLKNEKDQLEAKMSRMERRMLLGTKTVGKASNAEASKTADKERNPKRLSTPCAIDVTKKVKRASPSPGVAVNSKQFRDPFVKSYLHTSSPYLHDFQPPTKPIPHVVEKDKDHDVIVPGWKVLHEEKQRRRSTCEETDEAIMDDIEASSDSAFVKRHQKPEIDERRRKRWDVQRMRQEHMQEALRQKQRAAKKGNKGCPEPTHSESGTLNTLAPPLNRLLQIEVGEEVPVCAFGCRVASLESSEFNLPWFDVGKREMQLRKQNAKQATGTRGRRKTLHV